MAFRKGDLPLDPVTTELEPLDLRPDPAADNLLDAFRHIAVEDTRQPGDPGVWGTYLQLVPGEKPRIISNPPRVTGGEYLIKAVFGGDQLTSFTSGPSWLPGPIDWPFPPRPRRPYDWQTHP